MSARGGEWYHLRRRGCGQCDPWCPAATESGEGLAALDLAQKPDAPPVTSGRIGLTTEWRQRVLDLVENDTPLPSRPRRRMERELGRVPAARGHAGGGENEGEGGKEP